MSYSFLHFSACNNEDSRVVENVELAAEYMGYFVPPATFCPLILLSLEGNPSTGHLRALASILQGSPKNVPASELEDIASFLQQNHICQSRKSLYQHQILRCCECLVTISGRVRSLFLVLHLLNSFKFQECCEITSQLFKTIFHVLSMSKDHSIKTKCEVLLDRLAGIENLPKREDLLRSRTRPIMMEVVDSQYAIWTIYTPEFEVFQSCFVNASCAIASNFDLILLVLEKTTSSDADPEVRLKHFITLAKYFGRENDFFDKCRGHMIDSILDKVIFPSLIWNAGRAAEAIRTASVCCLSSLLEKILLYVKK